MKHTMGDHSDDFSDTRPCSCEEPRTYTEQDLCDREAAVRVEALEQAAQEAEISSPMNGLLADWIRALIPAPDRDALEDIKRQERLDEVSLMRCQDPKHNQFEPDNCNCVFCKRIAALSPARKDAPRRMDLVGGKHKEGLIFDTEPPAPPEKETKP